MDTTLDDEDLVVSQPRGAGIDGVMVERGKLVRNVLAQMDAAGLVFICAPEGFGKTALLLQAAAVLSENPACGPVRTVSFGGMRASEMVDALEELSSGVPGTESFALIDNFPLVEEQERVSRASRLRQARKQGLKMAIATEPGNRPFIAGMGDSAKVNASALIVRPSEYAAWIKAFSISSTLDVYGLTRGIPSLVVALKDVAATGTGRKSLDTDIQGLLERILSELKERRDPLYRLLSLMVLMGEGNLSDLERTGLRIKQETISSLLRDYPVMNYDSESREFSCLGGADVRLVALRRRLVSEKGDYAMRAVRALVRGRRVDNAVARMREYLDVDDCMLIVAQFPVVFPLYGHASFVKGLMGSKRASEGNPLVGFDLAAWMSALMMGDYRLARALTSDLRRRADEIESEIDPEDWDCALAAGEIWMDSKGLRLPQMPSEWLGRASSAAGAELREYAHGLRVLLGGSRVEVQVRSAKGQREDVEMRKNEVYVPRMLTCTLKALQETLLDGAAEDGMLDERLASMVRLLTERELGALAVRARVALNARRLSLSKPLTDERAFCDGSKLAVRESNLGAQMLCLMLEGCQFATLGQMVNAQFRAQQVVKLADESMGLVVSWSQLLEKVAELGNNSAISVREEADMIDLSQEGLSVSELWCVALHLSAARYDADLAAWYSLNHAVMLAPDLRGRVRVALSVLGEKGAALRRLLPKELVHQYGVDAVSEEEPDVIANITTSDPLHTVGQVNIELFGGFKVMRNGHVLTDEIWKRRKAVVIAARLALAKGSFIPRSTITQELWPDMPYQKARQNLYVTLTSLRKALGQDDRGPQYLIGQSSGLALNMEYVSCDVAYFDLLARDILLKNQASSPRRIVELCLKLEEIYKGPLFEPEVGGVEYYTRQRASYESRFVDCMVHGIDAAIEQEDVSSASWLADAVIKQAPTREDVVRRAMKVLDMSGRRRELVQLYESHLYYLEHELDMEPEKETKELYRKLIDRTNSHAYL